jgi:DNA-binding NarL/FixJ family response regulator
LSPKSVDNQKFRIMSKIGVNDKVSLALYAVREGLIQP